MAYWLVKSEPSVYSFAQLQRDKKIHWDGVRNFQAANNLRAMQRGDLAFFYHSNDGKEIVGIAEIVKTAYPDPSDKSGKFVMVDIIPKRALKNPVSLAVIKAQSNLKEMALIRQSRLSVMPVKKAEWDKILELAE